MLTSQVAPIEGTARDELHNARSLLARGFARARAGAVTEALDDLSRVRSAPQDDLTDLDRASLLTTAVDCRLARGELNDATALGHHLSRYLDLPGLVGATAHFGRGELAAALGEPERAAGHFTCAGRLTTGGREHPDVLPWRASAALTAARLGHRTEAVDLARGHLALARGVAATYAVALGLRTLAAVVTHGDRTELLREARSTLAGIPAARLAAQIDTDLAGQLLLGGGPEARVEALRLLRHAEEYAGHQELWPLHSRVRRLLDLMGEPPRPVLNEALAALTPAERRVARLAAGGLTNREIARQLVVTVKAVEWHLSHVYRKLDIRSRTALAGTLGPSA